MAGSCGWGFRPTGFWSFLCKGCVMEQFELIYSILLMAAVLVSSLANRSILSTSVMFLVGGILLSELFSGVYVIAEEDPLVLEVAKVALFASLFVDGMMVGIKDLQSAWRLPGRALIFGMPLTMLFIAILAKVLTPYSWMECFLIGAILSPTDPVFASAIIGARNIPHRLRHLLHVESGINDGLALPVVLILLSILGGGDAHYTTIGTELINGILIGIAIPFVAIKLEQSRFFEASPTYRPLNAFAIGLLVLGVSRYLHANEFLAAFAGGVTIATMSDEVREAFHQFGELISELLKLAALLIFGAIMSHDALRDIPPAGWLFVVLVLIVPRTISMFLAMIGSELTWKELGAAAWFGPRGFASVVYGLLMLDYSLENDEPMFHLIAAVVVISIVLHSSTDVVVAKLFKEQSDETPPEGVREEGLDHCDTSAEPH